MELYKKEKINPIAGCWPILLQIPVFFALYKVLYVTIEMRHAPILRLDPGLVGTGPDLAMFNLFGLLPYDVPAFAGDRRLAADHGHHHVPADAHEPDTARSDAGHDLFTWMPLVFTFMLASFPAGLVIYWAWNNTLSITQQAFIMKRHGAKVELFDNLKGLFSKKPKPAK